MRNNDYRRVRTRLLGAMLTTGTMLMSGAVALPASALAQDQGTPRRYDIAPGSLTDALNQFAEQSGLQLNYEAALTQGRVASGLQGLLPTNEALSRLLSGTGLVARPAGAGAVTIARATTGAMTLDPLTVTGVVKASYSAEEESEEERERNGRDATTIVVRAHQEQPAGQTSTGPWGARAVLDTPYAINVTSKDLIASVVAGDMDQIYKMNPVVQNSAPSTVYGTPYAAIRGFHTQSGVMDGLRLSSTSTGIAMEELERVEVMNGLSGFLYGVGNPGGVTNYVLKRPTYEQTVNLTVGNYGSRQWFAHADLSNRIDSAGVLAYRLNVSHQDGETSKQDQNVRRTLFSGAIDVNVTPDLRLQVEGAHTFYRVDGIDSRFYAYSNSAFGASDYWLAPLKNDRTYTPPWTYLQIKTDRIGANLKFAINETFSFRSAYLYKRDEQESINVFPAYFADSGFVNGWPSRSAPSFNIAQGAYAYLDSTFATFGIKHRLTVGASGDVLTVRRHVTNSISATNSPAYTDPDDLMTWAKPAAFADRDWGALYRSNRSRNFNIVIGDDIQFSESLSALIGINRTNIVTKAYSLSATSPTGFSTVGYDKTAVTPTLSLIFKPSRTVTTYASYMEGLENGSVTPNDPSYAEPGKILDPFISRQYEVGAKFTPRDGLLITAALYRIEKANAFEDVVDGKRTINQDGRQVHQGLELTLSGKVTDDLTLIAGGTLMDVKVAKATNAALEGKKPTGVAARLAKIYAQYQIPYVEGLSLSGGAFYSGPMFKDAVNLQKIPGYLVFDLGAHYRTEIGQVPVSFNLNVANITDKSYWATTFSLGIPRNVAFSVRAEF